MKHFMMACLVVALFVVGASAQESVMQEDYEWSKKQGIFSPELSGSESRSRSTVGVSDVGFLLVVPRKHLGLPQSYKVVVLNREATKVAEAVIAPPYEYTRRMDVFSSRTVYLVFPLSGVEREYWAFDAVTGQQYACSTVKEELANKGARLITGSDGGWYAINARMMTLYKPVLWVEGDEAKLNLEKLWGCPPEALTATKSFDGRSMRLCETSVQLFDKQGNYWVYDGARTQLVNVSEMYMQLSNEHAGRILRATPIPHETSVLLSCNSGVVVLNYTTTAYEDADYRGLRFGPDILMRDRVAVCFQTDREMSNVHIVGGSVHNFAVNRDSGTCAWLNPDMSVGYSDVSMKVISRMFVDDVVCSSRVVFDPVSESWISCGDSWIAVASVKGCMYTDNDLSRCRAIDLVERKAFYCVARGESLFLCWRDVDDLRNSGSVFIASIPLLDAISVFPGSGCVLIRSENGQGVRQSFVYYSKERVKHEVNLGGTALEQQHIGLGEVNGSCMVIGRDCRVYEIDRVTGVPCVRDDIRPHDVCGKYVFMWPGKEGEVSWISSLGTAGVDIAERSSDAQGLSYWVEKSGDVMVVAVKVLKRKDTQSFASVDVGLYLLELDGTTIRTARVSHDVAGVGYRHNDKSIVCASAVLGKYYVIPSE